MALTSHVGSAREIEGRTGFAHLFEHLMFGGSSNIVDFDGLLQLAGGQSNAFTSNDITNYYPDYVKITNSGVNVSVEILVACTVT